MHAGDAVGNLLTDQMNLIEMEWVYYLEFQSQQLNLRDTSRVTLFLNQLQVYRRVVNLGFLKFLLQCGYLFIILSNMSTNLMEDNSRQHTIKSTIYTYSIIKPIKSITLVTKTICLKIFGILYGQILIQLYFLLIFLIPYFQIFSPY